MPMGMIQFRRDRLYFRIGKPRYLIFHHLLFFG
jgi:hypothetical protein